MDLKKILGTFIEAVVFLFSAFSGFLTKIAPPEQTHTSYAVGIGSFFVLVVLLIIAALARNSTAKHRKRWLKAGILCFVVALPVGLVYPWTLSELTYAYPPPPDKAIAWRVNGWELTDIAKEFIKGNPGNYSAAQLELNLDYDDIWTSKSVGRAKMLLLINYTALVLALATAVFCLLEANFKQQRGKGKPSS